MYWSNNILASSEEDEAIVLLKIAGCLCCLPLIGFIPDKGPRCRVCGVESKFKTLKEVQDILGE